MLQGSDDARDVVPAIIVTAIATVITFATIDVAFFIFVFLLGFNLLSFGFVCFFISTSI